MQSSNLVSQSVPVCKSLEHIEVKAFDGFADGSLLFKILFLLLLASFEVFLMALVDDGRSLLEAVPYLFAEIVGNRSYLAEL